MIDRLLAGTPLRSNGSLTIVALADEAGVKRHLLTHRHTDLKDELYYHLQMKDQIEPLATTDYNGRTWPVAWTRTYGTGRGFQRMTPPW